MSKNNAYVYGHYKADTNELFYIGKGTGKRAWSTSKRNPYWQNVVDKHGYTVKILYEGLSEEDAYSIERKLILEVGLKSLTNITEGGDGFTSEFSKKLFNTNEFKQLRSEIQKERMQNELLRKTISEKMQGNTNGNQHSDDTINKIKQSRKEQWKDSEYRNNVLSARKVYKENGGKGPNAGKKFDKVTRKYYIPTEST